mgnify:CR=1 FL=1
MARRRGDSEWCCTHARRQPLCDDARHTRLLRTFCRVKMASTPGKRGWLNTSMDSSVCPGAHQHACTMARTQLYQPSLQAMCSAVSPFCDTRVPYGNVRRARNLRPPAASSGDTHVVAGLQQHLDLVLVQLVEEEVDVLRLAKQHRQTQRVVAQVLPRITRRSAPRAHPAPSSAPAHVRHAASARRARRCRTRGGCSAGTRRGRR